MRGSIGSPDFDAAQARARSENKPLLIDFTGSDWCPPCIRLRKQVFSKPEFADYAAKNLVLLEVDFPKRKTLPPAQQAANDTVARKFGVEGFPTLILLSPSGKTLGQLRSTGGSVTDVLAELERLRAAG